MERLVYIIDDDHVYLNFMKGHFRKMEGYTVETFPEGDEALKQLTTRRPYLIILDHNLSSDKDGLHYLKNIRKVKPAVPTIYITGDSTPSVKQNAMKAGAHSVIIKSDSFLVQLRTALDELESPKKGFLSKIFGK